MFKHDNKQHYRDHDLMYGGQKKVPEDDAPHEVL